MHKRFLILVFLASALSSTASQAIDMDERALNVFGYGFFPGYLCDDCRDPHEYPMDYAAFAFNGYFGDEPWLWNSLLGVPFRIYSLDRQYVAVWFERVFFDAPTLLPDVLEVRIRFQNGQIIRLTLLQDGPDLPIGSQIVRADPEPLAGTANGTSGVGGEDGDDDYDDIDDNEFEEPEREGFVEIVDPDENGDFPEWHDEL